jgi:ABC-type nitrate/sulfonate/bicarbonate transport system substrate-binding protein
MLSRSRILSLLGAGAAIGMPHVVKAQSNQRVRIGTARADTYMIPYIANDFGYFARYGIETDITQFASSAPVVQAVAAGALDVGLGDMLQIATAVTHGVDLRFFAGGGLYSTDDPTTVLVVSKSSNIRSAKDLEGKDVGVILLKSISHMGTLEWLRQNGADVSKIRFFEVTFAEAEAALMRGTVSAAFVGEPFVTMGKDNLRVLGKSYDAIAKQFYINAWFSTKDWLTKNPDLARRLTSAIYDAARWANGHLADTAATTAKYTKIDPAVVAVMHRSRFGTSLDPRFLQPLLDLGYRYQVIDRPVKADEISMVVGK